MHGFFLSLAMLQDFFFHLDCMKSNGLDTEQLGKITKLFANICESFYSRAHFATTSWMSIFKFCQDSCITTQKGVTDTQDVYPYLFPQESALLPIHS